MSKIYMVKPNVKSKQTTATTKIPHPPRTFLLGNLPQIAGQDTIEKMIKLGYEYGPIFEIAILNVKVIFINNFELAKELLTDEERFPKFINVPLEHLRVVAGDGLFTAWTHEPNWKKAHNILIPGFSQRAMRGYVSAMKTVADQLLKKWEKIPQNEYINLSEDMTRYTFQTIGLCGFDYDFDSFKSEEQHEFVTAMLYALDEAVQRARVPPFLLPFRFKRNRLFNKHLDYVNNLVDNIIVKRKKNPEEYANKYDFLSLMLNARDKESGELLSDQNIRYQILTFMVAGHETTSGLLSFTFYNLLTHPEWLSKVYEEVDSVLGADIHGEITHREIAKMKLLRQVLFETLRLYPPVPILDVASPTDTTIGKEKYPIKAMQSIMIWPYHLHRDKAVWGDDPEAFNPDHFSPQNVAKRDPDAFKGFGSGQRACIGRQFALVEATIAVAMVLQRYKLHLDPNYKFGFNKTITLRPLDLFVKLEPRTDKDRYHLTPVETTDEDDFEDKNAAATAHHTPLLILYGSNMGSSEELAYQLVKDGKNRGFKTTLATLDDYAGKLPKEGLVQIVCSTYNGTPPDNARKFATWLEDCKEDFSGLQYAVFGCGNSQWATYQQFPNFIDEKLSALGAKRLYEKGTADASLDFDEQFEKWYENYWASLFKKLNLQTDNTVKNTNFTSTISLEKLDNVLSYQHPSFSTQGHQWMEIVEHKELQNKALSGRSTKHLEIKLPEGMTYQVGDYLSVLPYNSEKLVARVCKRFGLDPHSYVKISSTEAHSKLPLNLPISFHDLLTRFVELQNVATRRQVKLLADITVCPPEKIRLQQYEQDYEQKIAIPKRSILSLLEEFAACEIPFELFLEQLPAMQIRYYSIASSPKIQPNQCSLSVAVLKDGDFEGVCSNYLATSNVGEKILAMVRRPALDYSLPENPETPIIMIGAGTGIAPFMGFLQERTYLKNQGKNLGRALLFFGCRHPEQDFLYKEVLHQAEAANLVELHTAFSRENAHQKVYVQDKVLAEKEQVWQLLQQGAIVYICGDAAGMAKGVERALLEIFKEKNAAENAEQWLQDLKDSGRYRLEIW